MTKISIVMPAFNAAIYIEQAIQSVINQTYRNWELIIVDDGSTDGTANIIKPYLDDDSRIRYLYQQNGKQGKARNQAIKISQGTYIAFLDSDDLWHPEKLHIQIERLLSDNTLDLVFSQGYQLINNLIENYNVNIKNRWDKTDINTFIDSNQIPILSVLVKKTALLAVNNFTEDPKIQNVEDYHLWLKLLLIDSKFTSLEDRLFYYRIHDKQTTFQNRNIEFPIFYTYLNLYYLSSNRSIANQFYKKLEVYLNHDEYFLIFERSVVAYFKNKGIPAFRLFFGIVLKSRLISRKKIARLITFYK